MFSINIKLFKPQPLKYSNSALTPCWCISVQVKKEEKSLCMEAAKIRKHVKDHPILHFSVYWPWECLSEYDNSTGDSKDTAMCGSIFLVYATQRGYLFLYIINVIFFLRVQE